MITSIQYLSIIMYACVVPTLLKKLVSVSMSDTNTDTCNYVKFIHFFKLLPESQCHCQGRILGVCANFQVHLCFF